VTVTRDLPPEQPGRPRILAGLQVGVSIVAGLVLGSAIASIASWALLPLLSWDIACLVYLVWVWRTIWPLDAERTARLAVPADPTRATADLLTLSSAVVSLVAVGFVLGRAANSQGTEQVLLGLLGVTSVVLSWAVVHTVYTLRLARLYYTGTDGGIDFNEDDPPSYSDFAYVSFTIGMTFQVSDTALQNTEVRRTALSHALLSYLFGTGILAATINLIVNLGGQ
jgi:uncharacterized membrane protein